MADIELNIDGLIQRLLEGMYSLREFFYNLPILLYLQKSTNSYIVIYEYYVKYYNVSVDHAFY